MTIISVAWLSISRPLAIISVVSITTISVANMSIAISMTISISGLSSSSSSGLGISSWFSIGSRLSISRSLAIISMVTIAISMTISRLGLSGSLTIVSMVTISIAMSITMTISMSIIAISRLGNSHTQEGKRNSKQKFHVVSSSFSSTLVHNSHIQARQQPYPG